MSAREMNMPSREINVRCFCANIKTPARFMHVVKISFFHHFISKGNKFSFLSVNLPVRRSPSIIKEKADKLM